MQACLRDMSRAYIDNTYYIKSICQHAYRARRYLDDMNFFNNQLQQSIATLLVLNCKINYLLCIFKDSFNLFQLARIACPLCVRSSEIYLRIICQK